MHGTHYQTIKEHLLEMVASANHAIEAKTIWSLVIGGGTYLIGGQNFNAGLAIIVLVTLDLATAIIAQYKLGFSIESRRALKSATKLVIYGVFLSAVHLTEVVVPGTTFMDEAALAFLALTELISVMENIGKMGYPMPKKLLNQLNDLRNEK